MKRNKNKLLARANHVFGYLIPVCSRLNTCVSGMVWYVAPSPYHGVITTRLR